MGYTSRDIAKGMHYAGFMLEEIRDVLPKIMTALPKHIDSDHEFFNVQSSIEKIATEKGIKPQEARPLALADISTIIDIHEYPEPKIAEAAAIDSDEEGDNDDGVIYLEEELTEIPEELREIAETCRAQCDATGKRPVSGSSVPFTHGPLAFKMTPAAAFVRIRNFAHAHPGCGFTTYGQFLDHFSIGKTSKTGRPSVVTAKSLFNALAEHIKNDGDIELLRNRHFLICSIKVSSINEAFRRATLDVSEYLPEGAEPPKTVHEFAEKILGLDL